MSWSLSSPMFPSLAPRATDPLWFSVDKPRDEETELAREEAEHNAVRDIQLVSHTQFSVYYIPSQQVSQKRLKTKVFSPLFFCDG